MATIRLASSLAPERARVRHGTVTILRRSLPGGAWARGAFAGGGRRVRRPRSEARPPGQAKEVAPWRRSRKRATSRPCEPPAGEPRRGDAEGATSTAVGGPSRPRAATGAARRRHAAGPAAPGRAADLGRPARLTVEDCERRFDATDRFTVGVEEELMLLSPRTLDLYPGIDSVLDRLAEPTTYRRELREAQLEIVTGVERRVDAASAAIESARIRASRANGGFVRLAGAGTHPISTDWGAICAGERYRLLEDEFAWATRRSMACGLHVHVAVGRADTALAVHNALRSFLPELAALAANSPFFDGRDSGLCSIRPKLNEAMPRSGIPPAFPTWADYVGFLDWGRHGGLFPDGTHLWWDLRLHPEHGTLELRVADTQTGVADVAAIAAFAQSLVAWLAERHEAGEALPVHDAARIAENAWRALRYGVQGWLVDLDGRGASPARERIGTLLVELAPVARRLGCEHVLAGAQALLAGNGADRQRYVAAREGIAGLVRWLADATDPRSPGTPP
ncbi:MAG: YbdK family carboxylate-amine ligase [Thermoleophilia bacterium]